MISHVRHVSYNVVNMSRDAPASRSRFSMSTCVCHLLEKICPNTLTNACNEKQACRFLCGLSLLTWTTRQRKFRTRRMLTMVFKLTRCFPSSQDGCHAGLRMFGQTIVQRKFCWLVFTSRSTFYVDEICCRAHLWLSYNVHTQITIQNM